MKIEELGTIENVATGNKFYVFAEDRQFRIGVRCCDIELYTGIVIRVRVDVPFGITEGEVVSAGYSRAFWKFKLKGDKPYLSRVITLDVGRGYLAKTDLDDLKEALLGSDGIGNTTSMNEVLRIPLEPIMSRPELVDVIVDSLKIQHIEKAHMYRACPPKAVKKEKKVEKNKPTVIEV